MIKIDKFGKLTYVFSGSTVKKKTEARMRKVSLVVRKKNPLQQMKHCWQLYVLLLPTALYFIIFSYLPMAGVQIAFKQYTVSEGIWGSSWVGLKHFARFMSSAQCETLIVNTLKISIYSLLWSFPLPIVLAIALNECRFLKMKKIVQSLTYAPHFISTVVLVSMVTLFLSPSNGVINRLIEMFGGEAHNFMGETGAFRTIYIASGIWQNCGWSAIIYISALSGVDEQLHEAAKIDGANRLQRIRHIDIPSILPTAITLFILNCGNVLSVGFEKMYLMQNSMNLSVSEIISTYTYKVGLLGAQYSYTAAIGLFNSVVNIIILVMVNAIAKKTSETSLF